jgi:hypothetical protein
VFLICKSKAIDDTSLQGTCKLFHSWVIVRTTVQINNTKYVLKGILIKVSGLKVLETGLFQHPPHMPDSNPFCDRGLLTAGLPSLRKIQLLIPMPASSQQPI